MTTNMYLKYVMNADNTTRQLLIHKGEKTSNGLVFKQDELQRLKNVNENQFENLQSKDSKDEERVVQKPKLVHFIPKPIDKQTKSKLFYNGEVSNHVNSVDNKREGLDKQLQDKREFENALEKENKRFDEMLEDDRKLFLAKVKCTTEGTRKANKKNQEDLIQLIRDSKLKKKEEMEQREPESIEKYIIGRKNSAKKLEVEYQKCFKNLLDNQRKDHDINAFNITQKELKDYAEVEDKKLNEIADHIEDQRYQPQSPRERDIDKELVKHLKEKRLLEAQIELTKIKLSTEQRRNQFENKYCAPKDDLNVNTDILKKRAAKEELMIDKRTREKWLEEEKYYQKKMDNYYDEMAKKLNAISNCKAKNRALTNVMAEFNYRKSLERQMEEEERSRKLTNKDDMNIEPRQGSSKALSKVKPEDLPEQLWRQQVWSPTHNLAATMDKLRR